MRAITQLDVPKRMLDLALSAHAKTSVGELSEAERVALCFVAGCKTDISYDAGTQMMSVKTHNAVGIVRCEGRWLITERVGE